jgi:hypothetical protein
LKKIIAVMVLSGVAVFGSAGIATAQGGSTSTKTAVKAAVRGNATTATNSASANSTVTGPSVSGQNAKVQNTKVKVSQSNVAGTATGDTAGGVQTNGNVTVSVTHAPQ